MRLQVILIQARVVIRYQVFNRGLSTCACRRVLRGATQRSRVFNDWLMWHYVILWVVFKPQLCINLTHRGFSDWNFFVARSGVWINLQAFIHHIFNIIRMLSLGLGSRLHRCFDHVAPEEAQCLCSIIFSGYFLRLWKHIVLSFLRKLISSAKITSMGKR